MTYNPFSLEGKIILITGASSGIGRSIAIECSRMGASVILTGRNQGRLDETYLILEKGNHQIIVADLSIEEEVKRLVDELPVVDGCVNNAGLNIMQPIPFIKEKDSRYLFEVNTLAPILLTNQIVKKKKIKKGGSMVFTSSISGLGIAAPGNCLYSASKGALNSFMKNAAIELAQKQIRCNAILPGMIETPLKDGKSFMTEEMWEYNKQLYPLKRFGKPEDVAYGVIYFLSDASNWITGTELVIDGGRKLK